MLVLEEKVLVLGTKGAIPGVLVVISKHCLENVPVRLLVAGIQKSLLLLYLHSISKLFIQTPLHFFLYYYYCMIRTIHKTLSSVANALTRMRILAQVTSSSLQQPLSVQNNLAAYCGYDPTAKSLHIGHLPSFIAMINLQKLGIKPIFLVGGATGRIGDPSGKLKQRPQANASQIRQNTRLLQEQIDKIYRRLCKQAGIDQPRGLVVNNQMFYRESILEFLGKVGRHFRVNQMIKRDSIRLRLQSHQGINLNQFIYTTFQGYDFLRLFQVYNCRIQIGGSDQYSNILSGVNLVKKLHNQEVFGATLKLLTTPQGAKLGKTQGNSLFLDSRGQSIYHYILNLPDSFFPDIFYQLSFREPQQADIQKQKRELGLHLSLVLSDLSEQQVKIQQSQLAGLQHSQLVQYFSFQKQRYKIKLLQPLIQSLTLVLSRNSLRKNVCQGAIRINGRKILESQLQRVCNKQDLIGGRFMVLRIGRKRFVLLQQNDL